MKKKKNGDPIPIDVGDRKIVAQRPWVRVSVNAQNRVQVESNAPGRICLALLCDGAAAISKQAIQDEAPKSNILVPTGAILKPS